MKTAPKQKTPRPLTDSQIMRWLAGKLNRKKGAFFELSFQDSRDMGYRRNRISAFSSDSPRSVFDKGNTVRHALSSMIRRERATVSKIAKAAP